MLTGWEILKGLFLGDTYNGFNNLSRLSMLWTVHHQWLGGAQFAFNYYRHSLKLLVGHPGEVDPEDLLSREGVTQGDPLSIVLYRMRPSMLVEKIHGEYPRLI